MRALVVTHYFAPHVGGVESVSLAHAVGLARLGWEVEVHTTRLSGDPQRHEVDGVRVVRHLAWNPLEHRLHVPVPFPTPRIVAELAAAARSADVVITHGHVYPTSIAAALAARRTDRPLVVVQHSPFVEYPLAIEMVERLADRSIGRWVLHQADVIACVSAFTASFVHSTAPAAPTAIVPNGVDTDRFHPASGPYDVEGKPRVVSVRRLVPRNGLDLLVEAWRLGSFGDRAELVIGGSGPQRRVLEEQAGGLPGLSFAGFIPDEELADFYGSACVAVMPTRSGEGFGLMAAEALACGVPVIVADQGALPELVGHGVNGLIVPARDARALAAAIQLVIDDADLRRQLAAGAQATVLSWDRSSTLLDAVLRDVCRRRAEA